jgi:hypothetical protein
LALAAFIDDQPAHLRGGFGAYNRLHHVVAVSA